MSRTRRWLELRVGSPGASKPDPRLAEGLLALGGRAVEERDGAFLTHLPEPEELEDFLAAARRHLEAWVDGESLSLDHRWQRHEDWATTWKRGLRTRRITPRLVVTPSWIPVEAGPGEQVVVVDPGMAFGTAEHGTTRGALRLLDTAGPGGATVLDLGAGSGILSIAALLLGAASATLVEGDELACEALRENLAANAVAERARVVEAWADDALLHQLGPHDLVLANVEWTKLRGLMEHLLGGVAPGGALVVSGLQHDDLASLGKVVAGRGFQEYARDVDEGWHSRLFRRPADAGPGGPPVPPAPSGTSG